MIPGLNPIEYHPFSLSSSWEADTTTIHIRALGDWSKRLLNKVKKLQEENENQPVPMRVFVEGPYGAPSIDHESKDYKVWLLISGGIGITPLQSMYNHFIDQVESGERNDLRKVIFVWSVKDKATAEAIEADRRKASYLPLSFQPTMKPPPKIKLTRVIPGLTDEQCYIDDSIETGGTKNAVYSDKDNNYQRASDSANEDGFELNTDLIFHAEYYLTKVRNEEEFAAAGIDPVEQKHLHFGRPNLPEVFERTRALCASEGIKRVGVMVCGPQGMINEVMDFCQKTQLSPQCSTVRFDGHSEVFDF